MDRVITLSSFEQEEPDSSSLEYWLSRPPHERVEEVDRLRREFATLSKKSLGRFREIDYLAVDGHAVAEA